MRLSILRYCAPLYIVEFLTYFDSSIISLNDEKDMTYYYIEFIPVRPSLRQGSSLWGSATRLTRTLYFDAFFRSQSAFYIVKYNSHI